MGSLLKMSKDLYEVYVCKHDDEIVYIGQGTQGRHKHCTSGCSHVYALNKLHFEGCNIAVKVISMFETREESLAYEKSLIISHQPKYNTVFANDNRNVNRYKVEVFTKSFKEALSKYSLKGKNGKNLEALTDEFFDFYKIMSCLSGEIIIYSTHHFKNIGRHTLKALSRSLRDDTSSWAKDNYCLVFAECFESVVGYSLTTKLHNLDSKGKDNE